MTLVSGDPTDIYPGQTTRLQITLSNNNPTANHEIVNVGFSTTLPGSATNGLKFAGAATYTCTSNAGAVPASGTLTLDDVTRQITLVDGIIPAGAYNAPPPPTVPTVIDGYCTIRVPVTAVTTSGADVTYAYAIGAGVVTGTEFTSGIALANVGLVSQSINVRALNKPTITKAFDSSTLVLGGAPTTLRITVGNTNPVAISGFSIADTFPVLGAGGGIIKVVDPLNATSTCTGVGVPATFAPNLGDKTLSATGGTLPANGSCTLTVPVEADHTNGAYSTGVRTNRINAATQFGNDIGIAAAADATADITVNSPLGVTKTVSAGSIAAGATGTFTITLSNSGGAALTVGTFTDSPIDGATGGINGLTVTGHATTCAGGGTAATLGNEGVTLTGGTIPAGGNCTVTIDFTGAVQAANTPVTYTNTIAAGAVDVGIPAIVSQSRSATVTIYDTLDVSKSVTPTNAAPGSPVRYTVTVRNWTVGDINNVVITDNLVPGGLSFLNGTINGVNYTPTTTCNSVATANVTGNTTVTLTIGTLPARTSATVPGSCSVNFWAMTSTAGGNYSNQLGANTVCYAGPTCNGGASNTAGPHATVSALTVAKTFSHGGTTHPGAALSRPEGTIVRMAITLSNLSVNPLTNVNIADTLPIAVAGTEQLKIANPSNAATTCGGAITAVAGTSSVSLNGGTVPARAASGGVPGTGAAGSCTLLVDVVGAAGTYNNTATVTATHTYADNTTQTVNVTSNPVATVTFASALSAIKSFTPATVSSGGKSTVRVRLTNTGAIAQTNVAVTDPLPTGMVLASPPNAYSTCAGGTSITAVAGAGTASLSGAAIAGNGDCDFIFDVVATGAANWVNTIPIGNITADGGVRNQSPVTATLLFQAPTNLTVAKATMPSTLTFPGQTSQLTITINNGSTAVTGLRLTDHFTADGTAGAAANGMVIAATAVPATTCPGGSVSAAAGARSVALTGVSLAAGASCTVTVNVTSTAVGGITNFIPVGAIVTDQGLSNNGQATTSLTTQSNIGVAKQFTPNVVKPGERSRLRITFYNATVQPAANVAVLDTLPAGVTVAVGPNPTTTCVGAAVSSPAPNQVQVSGGSIVAAAGNIAASCQAEIDVVVAAQGEYVNTIPAGGVTATIGGGPATNAEPASDTLRARSPIVVHKAFSSRTLDAGNPVGFTTGSDAKAPGAVATMTVRLDNPNAVALNAAAFTDTLPNGLVVAGTPNAATTCAGGSVAAAPSATSVRLSGAIIPASGFCTVTVDVLSNISGSYTNTIPSGGVTTFEGVSNEDPTSARIVISTPPTVSKQFVPAVIPPGGISRLSIVLGNSNTVTLTLGAIFTDTLPTVPGNIVVAATPNVNSSCGGAVTAAPGAGSVSLASGGTIPAGGCTISLDVTGSTPGVHNNNIPAGALQTDFGNNQQPANATLTISTLGYISGRAFLDNNVVPNGGYDAGTDTPLQGVSIELHGGATCAGALLATATTDALGNYLFSGLAAGTYSVCEPVQPTGTSNGITTAGGITAINGSGGIPGTAANPTATTSQITNIVLNANGGGDSISGSAGNNFAEIVLSGISGTVFLDQNNNGLQNGADIAIAGVTIQLSGYSYGANGVDNGGGGDDVAVSATNTTTDASGNYSFTGLLPGKYSVTEPTQPTGTSNGITTPGAVPNGGTVGTATGVLVLPSRLSGIVLPPNTTSTGNNFAEIPNGRTLSGRVFLDFNNDGTINGSDHGIGGQTINLTGTDINGNAVTRTATTANDGSYSFTALPEGTYTVTQPNQPTGTTNGQTLAGSAGGVATAVGVVPSAISAISLTGATTVSANNNFAEVPGAAPDLTIVKSHTPASFGEGSSTGYFTITPSNLGPVATSGTVTIVDTLPVGLTVAAPATGTGWTCVGAIGATTVTCTTTNVIAANGGTGNPITLRVAVAMGTAGQILTNTAVVSCPCEPAGWDSNNTATDPVPIANTARVSGTVWRDADHDRVRDPGETVMANWAVELLLGSVVVATTTTDAAGAYTIGAIAPGSGYTLRFREPTSQAIYGHAVTNEQGIAVANGTRDTGQTTRNLRSNAGNPAGADLSSRDGTLSNLKFLAGDDIVEQSLPLDPSGVVYDAITRQPVAGAVVEFGRMVAGVFTPVAGTCLVGGTASITTPADGYYEFLLLPGPPAGCPGTATYTLRVTSPGAYLPAPSSFIPACVPATLNVGAGVAPVQANNTAPGAGAADHRTTATACPANTPFTPAAQASTQYYYNFILTLGVSGNVINNHIPLDPVLSGAIVMTKTTPLVNVTRGQLVPYTFTATSTLTATLTNVNVRDQIPPGFRYRVGSATLNGIPSEPTIAGRDLIWPNLTFTAGERKTWKMILTVGAGVGEGLYTNAVWSLNNLINAIISNIATATVRIVPDPTFDCSDIIGKVFDDKNANGYQDEGEPGIANVRVATARGLLVTSDAEGRFHVACAAIPQADHGSNFIMKLDERTLPSGYRLTTENPRDVRVTRGKLVKLNFGATVHRVVRLELAGSAFAGDGTDLAPDWDSQIRALPDKLKERPSVLRIAYRLGLEAADLGRKRLDALADKIKALWQAGHTDDEAGYPLLVETELEGTR